MTSRGSSVSGASPTVNRTWRPALAVTGQAGLPDLASAGNVLRPTTALKLSIRLPPGADPVAADVAVKRALETDPPQGARVRFDAFGECRVVGVKDVACPAQSVRERDLDAQVGRDGVRFSHLV